MNSYIYLFVLGLSLLSFSCKDDEEPEQYDDLPGALVANINGESFDFRYQPRAYEGAFDNGEIYDAIFISGTTSVDYTRELNISIINPAIGTFELDSETLSDIYYTHVFEDGTGESYGSISGSIIVEQLGDRIKGTFNSTMINNDAVEIPIDGSFDLNITE